jgi:hypothetical protein
VQRGLSLLGAVVPAIACLRGCLLFAIWAFIAAAVAFIYALCSCFFSMPAFGLDGGHVPAPFTSRLPLVPSDRQSVVDYNGLLHWPCKGDHAHFPGVGIGKILFL